MRFAIATALLCAACSRPPVPSTETGGDAESAVDASTRPAPEPLVDEKPPATFREARRAQLTTLEDEPGLAKSADAIRAHFGGTLPSVMVLQAAALGGGKQMLLLHAVADDPKPIAILVDATGSALWIKERPLAGITPPAKPFALAPRPDNGVAIFVYDEPTHLVAARMSAADGAPYAELVLFELPRCDAISAAWWPDHGWIVVTSFPGGARAQLVREQGSAAWGPQGIAVGEAWRAPAPASIVIDDDTSSWLLVQHATRAGADHVVTSRYDAQGNRLAIGAADLGAVPHVKDTLDRIDATPAGARVVRVDVAGKSVEMRIDGAR
jgi:hypothetical protein